MNKDKVLKNINREFNDNYESLGDIDDVDIYHHYNDRLSNLRKELLNEIDIFMDNNLDLNLTIELNLFNEDGGEIKILYKEYQNGYHYYDDENSGYPISDLNIETLITIYHSLVNKHYEIIEY